MKPYPVTIGHRYPAGATVSENGTNFCIFSRHASAVTLLLYEKPDSNKPFQIIDLDPAKNRNETKPRAGNPGSGFFLRATDRSLSP